VRVAIAGAGKVGTALAVALRRAGHRIVAIASRTPAAARALARRTGARATALADVARAADLVLITTPDRAVAAACRALLPGLRRRALVVHCSGALTSAVLAPARRAGARVGALHPLQTFAGVRDAAPLFRGIAFCLEGDRAALPALGRLARDLGGRPMRLPAARRPLYPAAASTASNFVVTLVWAATRMLARAGAPARSALPALLPLLQGTLRNLETLGLPRALTGPIARGDAALVDAHRRALRRAWPAFLPAHRELALLTVALARELGAAPPAALGALERRLRGSR
jgi:predicted short-subunit dehydrogenase-like oxidoreductase (DUF2520 family)